MRPGNRPPGLFSLGLSGIFWYGLLPLLPASRTSGPRRPPAGSALAPGEGVVATWPPGEYCTVSAGDNGACPSTGAVDGVDGPPAITACALAAGTTPERICASGAAEAPRAPCCAGGVRLLGTSGDPHNRRTTLCRGVSASSGTACAGTGDLDRMVAGICTGATCGVMGCAPGGVSILYWPTPGAIIGISGNGATPPLGGGGGPPVPP